MASGEHSGNAEQIIELPTKTDGNTHKIKLLGWQGAQGGDQAIKVRGAEQDPQLCALSGQNQAQRAQCNACA